MYESDRRAVHPNLLQLSAGQLDCNYQQDNWADLLSLTEFSYNNAQHASIGCSLFYSNYGFNPRFTVNLKQFDKYPVPTAKEMAEHIKDLHENLTELIKATQNQQAKYYDAKHKPVEFKVGDKVWLRSSNIHTQCPSKKLDWKHLGPYLIIKKIGIQAYWLQLPTSIMSMNSKSKKFSILSLFIVVCFIWSSVGEATRFLRTPGSPLLIS